MSNEEQRDAVDDASGDTFGDVADGDTDPGGYLRLDPASVRPQDSGRRSSEGHDDGERHANPAETPESPMGGAVHDAVE
jgi:hypothetical protein